MDRERIVQVFFFLFLAVMAYELYQLLYPFLAAIIWAMLLGFVFYPLMVQACRVTKSRSTAALAITLGVALGVILPGLWLASAVASEAASLYAALSELVRTTKLAPLKNLALHSRLISAIGLALARAGIDLQDEITKIVLEGAKATSNLMLADITGIARDLVSFVIHFGMMLFTLFYVLRDGEAYYETLRNLTPLHEDDKRAVFETLRLTLSSVMRGLLLTALLQGVTLGLMYSVLGVPYWTFLAMLTAACGLLPFGGTALIWVPASLYLLYAYGWGHAVVMLVWGTLSVAVIDNFIKPAAMGQDTGLPTLAVFFGIAGGLEAYGAVGLFAGPAVIAVFAALLRVYRKTYGAARREAA
jgi:predicted PurR-regulated permease PerM